MPHSTTYYVYRIVCFATGKCYIGKTYMPKRRKTMHWALLKANTHHSPKLQRAFNKYGKGNFFFEVLEREIKEKDIDAREMAWIATFNSFKQGYNCSVGGSTVGSPTKPCIWNGIEYPSRGDAAKALGITLSSMYHRIQRGYTCDNDVPGRMPNPIAKTKPCVWNGIKYPSIVKAAEALGIDRGAMRNRIALGYICDEDLRKSYDDRSIPCTWNGIQYRSLTEAAQHNGVSTTHMMRRIQQGYTCDEDIKSKHKGVPCTWNGVEYPSFKAAAAATNIQINSLRRYILNRGYTCDDDVERYRNVRLRKKD